MQPIQAKFDPFLSMTQGQLTEAIGAMQKSISRYETGLSIPSLETLERIAKALKKPFGYFLDE
ncbi:MAG: helix-turn-helix transcriptional regulator [Rhabdochlamydiaceae bacterium]|nr:helix-turn-helix transcriptional regulator [Rhabdochlamydiaceae bacterium]